MSTPSAIVRKVQAGLVCLIPHASSAALLACADAYDREQELMGAPPKVRRATFIEREYAKALTIIDELRSERDAMQRRAESAESDWRDTGADFERCKALVGQITAVVTELVENHGPWHDEDCPGDDTCDCTAKPMHDAINAAMKSAAQIGGA